MGNRKAPIYPNNYYHIYNRGNNHKNIFIEERNYSYFLNKIFKSFGDKVELIAYCFMPNHYHLIAYPKESNSLQKAMQAIAPGYARAINKAYSLEGHLFEGTYKSKIIPDNNYLLHLSRYIHLNPVRAQLVNFPEEWRHSSYLEYLSKRKNLLLKTDIILSQFNSIKLYQDFVNSYSERDIQYVRSVLI